MVYSKTKKKHLEVSYHDLLTPGRHLFFFVCTEGGSGSSASWHRDNLEQSREQGPPLGMGFTVPTLGKLINSIFM